jgi:SAM-dependent MidA family methyltransferase
MRVLKQNLRKAHQLQAFKGHAQVHPLTESGSADLTASVNFALLKAAANEALSEAGEKGTIAAIDCSIFSSLFYKS